MSIDFDSLDKRMQSAFQRLDDNLNMFANLQKKAESARQEFEKASGELRALESEMKAVLENHKKQFSDLTGELDAYARDIQRLKDILLSAQKELLAFADKRIGDHLDGVNASLGDLGKTIDDLDSKVDELGTATAKLQEDLDSARDRLKKAEKWQRLFGAFVFIALIASFISVAMFLLNGR